MQEVALLRTAETMPTPSSPASSPPRTRYAPDQAAVASELLITDQDVLAVIDARGGTAYSASVDTGLTNRYPFVAESDRKRAVLRALASGAIVRTPMGVFRRPPREDD
jgi:hypothetical protein